MSGLIWVKTVCKSYKQTTIREKKLNEHADVSSRARSLHFIESLHQIQHKYSKTCVKRPLKNRQNKGLNDNW